MNSYPMSLHRSELSNLSSKSDYNEARHQLGKTTEGYGQWIVATKQAILDRKKSLGEQLQAAP